MKNVLKLTLAVVMLMGAESLFAQKFGRVDTGAIIAAMPEAKEAETNLQAFIKDLSDTYEAMQVEINNMVADLQKNEATLSDSMKQLKYKEIQDLSARMEEYQRSAQQDIQRKQAELMQPVQEKAMNAINKVSQAGGYTAIFETASLIYFDPAQMPDILDAVKSELGL